MRTINIEKWFNNDSFTNFLKTAFNQKLILRMVVTGMTFDSMRVVIQNFEYEKRSGEEKDTYYKLDLIEYRPYGARLMPMPPATGSSTGQTQTTKTRVTKAGPQRTNENKPSVASHYSVQPGDTIWSATQKLSGGSSEPDAWKYLYTENKPALAYGPNKLEAGTTLNVPPAWQTMRTEALAKVKTAFSNIRGSVGKAGRP